MKFIIVLHSWHVNSRGFRVKEVDVASEIEAYGEAKKMQDDIDSFYSSATEIIKISDSETINPRMLTFSERITGRIG